MKNKGFRDESTFGEQRKLSEIIPYEKNAKTHSKEQIDKLAESIKRLGWRTRIILDKNGVVINGHGRLEAAKKLKLKTAPVVVVEDLTDDQIRELRLVDNQLVGNDYDTRMLIDELKYLVKDVGVDMEWAFSERDLDFGLEDNGEINDLALTDDISADFQNHAAKTTEKIEEVDEKEVPVGKVFSFKSVTGSQARVFNLMEKFAEGQTDLKGADALTDYFEEVLGIKQINN